MEKINLVCLVEDDPVHAFIAQKVLGMTGMVNQVLIFENGKKIFDYLVERRNTGEAMPNLILLDLNMPIWDGWQFLDEAKDIDLLKGIPLYIITSSTDRSDRDRANQHQLLDHYLVKPLTLEKVKPVLDALQTI